MKSERDLAAGAVLIVAPVGKDASLAQAALADAGITARSCANLRELVDQLGDQTNAILLTEEALVSIDVPLLLERLAKQPAWSDIPLILLTRAGGGTDATVRTIDLFGPNSSVTLLERPLRAVTLITTVRAVLRARRRQYQVRDLFEQRESALTSISDAFAALDHEWRYVYVNDTAAKFAGLPRDQMIGRLIWDIYPQAVGGNYYKHLHRAVETQQPQTFEQYYERWKCWLETRIYPAGDGVVVFRANINERKKQEQAMREAERRLQENETMLRLAVEAADAGTFDYYPRTNELRFSERCRELFGVPPNVEITFEIFLNALHDRDRRAFAEAIQRALQSGGDGRVDIECRTAVADQKAQRWIATKGRVVFGADGTAERLIGTVLDMTERKNAEIVLQRAKTAAEAANRAKDQFLAMLSHELRTPLTPVLMTIAALQRDPTISDPVRADLQTIQRNIELEALLIDDLLDLTRIIHGKLELHSDAVDVHALIEHAIAMSVADADGKRLRLTRHLNATEHHCWADAARLQQVFWNLIKNAVKFTPAGGEVHVTTRNEGDHRVVIEVADTGVGITADVLPRIFDAFEQGGRSVTGKYGGLGLGLAISKSIIDLHDGSISAESAGRGRGSKFTVGLQAIATSLLDTPTYAVDRPSAARGMQRILLVEDHEDTARVFRRMLEHAGYAVHFARCIADAREVAAREEFDLVISDVGLPDGTGLDLMRELRQSKRLTGIALSGFGTDEDIAASREAGFAEHITKPVDWDRLRAVIERVAHASRADELSPA